MPNDVPSSTTPPAPNAGDPPPAQPKPQPPAAPKDPAGDPPKATEPKSDVLADLARERDKRQQLERTIAESLGIELKGGDPDNSHYAQITSKLSPLAKLAEALGATGDPATGKTDVEQLTERIANHEKQLADERAARFRAEVAHEKGLTPQQAERLQGTTRDELAKDADALLTLFPAEKGKKFGSGDGGARPGASQPGQLTRDEVKRMSPAEIVKAKAEGRLNDLLSGTTT